MATSNGFSVTVITNDNTVSTGFFNSLLYGSNYSSEMSNHFVRNGYHYCSLPHKTEYKLKLNNNHSTQCDASVTIDDEFMGVWRIPAYNFITIERPVKVQRKFTFMKEDSSEARGAGIVQGSDSNGLVKVVFTPEKEMFYNDIFYEKGDILRSVAPKKGLYHNENMIMADMNTNQMNYSSNSFSDNISTNNSFSFSNGATVLGNDSSQTFTTTTALKNIDTVNITTVNLRLVASEDSKPYISLREANRTMPVPPRINNNSKINYF
jgi:hypothetical protein